MQTDSSKSQMRVAIVVDNPVRDLPGCCLVAKSLLENNFKVDLVPLYGAKTYLFEKSYDIVLLNYARKNNWDLIRDLEKVGSAICILDTEGGVFGSYKEKDSNDYLQTVIEDKSVRAKIKKYFVWGDNVLNMVRKYKIYDDSQMELTGTPRSDFYVEPWVSFFELPEKYLQKFQKGFFLITSSFPMVNPAFQTVEAEKKMMIQTFDYSEKHIEWLFDQLKKAQEKYIQAALQVARKFPDVDFVFRPHPFEKLDIYKNAFGSQKNLHLIKEGVVGQWLMRSFGLIHFESSTSFEARFAKKPVFGFREFKDIWDMPEIQSVTDYVDSAEELEAKLGAVLEQRYQSPESVVAATRAIEKAVYFKIDGLAHQRITDHLLKIQSEAQGAKGLLPRVVFFTHQAIRMIGKRLLKWNPEIIKAKHFSQEETDSIMDQLEKISGSGVRQHVKSQGSLRFLGFTPVISISRYNA